MINKIKLTRHFTLSEMLATNTFNGNGTIYNCEYLTPDVYNNLVRTCNHLEILRESLDCPIRINSGFRCHVVNSAVHGATKSDHLTGNAVDIAITGFTDKQFKVLYDFVANYESVRYYEMHTNYIHISFYPYE